MITIKGHGTKDIHLLAGQTLLGIRQVMVLTGQRKKPDHLHWSGSKPFGKKDYIVCVQGLFNGSYADGEVLASDLCRALTRISMREAVALKRAWNSWVR